MKDCDLTSCLPPPEVTVISPVAMHVHNYLSILA